MNAELLPILAHRDRLIGDLKRDGTLILNAPTGSGKSTQIPQFLRSTVHGRILVLEPRRLSARSLAARIAAETKTPLGVDIGYQVRFDSRCQSTTQVVFQTYGFFTQTLRAAPQLPGIGAVVLDEFHERTLESDLSLAWLKALRKKRSDLQIVLMSATLDAEELTRYLPHAARVDVPGRMFPVDVRHSPLAAREGPAEGALRALQELHREGLDGSVLVFMPGHREIHRSMTVLSPFCRTHGFELLPLHGAMDLSEQQRALEPTARHTVIVATNVAETGLTIPGVTSVIDSGLQRIAAYDPARGINTLYVSRISRANAEQRAGRAGRTAPGRCVRLWSRVEESGMAARIKPEIERLELSSLFLQAAALPHDISWLTPPRAEAWSAARQTLSNLGAINDAGRITELGRALIRYPTPPRVGAVLEATRHLGPDYFKRACAMAAVFESSSDLLPARGTDLAALASDLVQEAAAGWPRETIEIYRQLLRLGDKTSSPNSAPDDDEFVRIWMDAFADRLAARDGAGFFYRLRDGRGATLSPLKDAPGAILALDVRERAGGGQAKQVTVNLFIPLSPEQIQRLYSEECSWTASSEFDDRNHRVRREEKLMFRGLTLARREIRANKEDRRAAAELWAEKYVSGELTHPNYDEKASQFVVRVRLAAVLYPDLGYPAMNADDWRLVYGEAFNGQNSLKDIERVNLLSHLETYLGPALKAHLDRVLPTARRLPSGKLGRFNYFEPPRAELAARLGDFVKMNGTLSLCEGRLPVIFDILAPNYRTVQKTGDLSSFWANTYSTVKKELARRYPKHPWP